jgi:P2 family phage contractile tail tube protein
MKFPKLLKAFNIFIDGVDHHAVIVDVTRPKISFKTNDYTPGGLMGVLKTRHGIEALELQLTMGGHEADVLGMMGGSIGSKTIRYQGALEDESTGEVLELVGEARGRINEADPGTDKQGDANEHKFTVHLTYYREQVNGKTIIEIDVMNNKCFINGKDYWAEFRKALGL